MSARPRLTRLRFALLAAGAGLASLPLAVPLSALPEIVLILQRAPGQPGAPYPATSIRLPLVAVELARDRTLAPSPWPQRVTLAWRGLSAGVLREPLPAAPAKLTPPPDTRQVSFRWPAAVTRRPGPRGPSVVAAA